MDRLHASRLIVGLLAAQLVACSPALDWRDVRPAGSELVMLFPCRPTQEERVVTIAGTTVPMRLASCTADTATFSLAVLDAGIPARVTLLMAALQQQAAANIGGVAQALPLAAPAASLPAASSVRIDGRLPDGRAVVEETFFFSRGTRIYQATILGAKPARTDTAETFFGSIRAL